MRQVPKLHTLTSALRLSWSRDTAYDPSQWTPSNPSRGQCVVSALIVQDYFGGELIRYAVKGESIDEMHYCNLLDNGTVVDTTASQYVSMVTFSTSVVDLKGYSSIREKRLADADTRRRYEILRGRVAKYVH